MIGLEKKFNVVRIAFVVALAAMLGGCDTDSPTEPTQTPNAPIPTSASTAFAISLGLSPSTVVFGDGTTVQVTVVARRTDNNTFVPPGSTVVLSTTSGALANGSGSVGSTVSLVFDINGTALATLTGPVESAVVRARIEQSTGEATLTVAEAPAIVPFSLVTATPNFGPPSGGTEVRIEGTGFSGPAEVIFGGIPVPVLSISSSVITVRSPQIELPSGTNQTVAIGVNVNIGEADAASGSLGSGFTYTRNTTPAIPKIISITPTSGPNEGGTRVTIFGEAFGSEVQVFFGQSSLIEAPILDVTPTRILVETPPATGQNSGSQNSVVNVRVRDLRSGFEATLPTAFQYGGGDMQITAASPVEGLYLGGTLVTIFGTGGFEAPVSVTFGGLGQQVVSVSGTEIVARSVPVEVSCNGQSGAFGVVNIETGESFGSSLSFFYRTAQPEIGSLSPNSTTVDTDTGAIVFGAPTTTTISGVGFDRQSNPPIVSIAGETSTGVSITSIDPNPRYEGYGIGDVMTAGIPPFFGSFATETCTIGTLTGTRFTSTRVDVVTTIRDTGCTTTLVSGFTYIPDDTSCRTAPNADFSFVTAGNTVTVTDESAGGPTAITWEWGDGSAAESGVVGGSTAHPYADPGTYTITLTAANQNGSSTSSKSVTVP